jgi:Holliday junction resolvase
MSRARAKGTAWESAIVNYLRDHGWPHAERRSLSGANDRGDIAGVVGVVIEAKSVKRVELAAILDEAVVEAMNAGGAVGAAWIKRRGKTSPGGGFVLMDGATFVRLLREAGYQ